MIGGVEVFSANTTVPVYIVSVFRFRVFIRAGQNFDRKLSSAANQSAPQTCSRYSLCQVAKAVRNSFRQSSRFFSSLTAAPRRKS